VNATTQFHLVPVSTAPTTPPLHHMYWRSSAQLRKFAFQHLKCVTAYLPEQVITVIDRRIFPIHTSNAKLEVQKCSKRFHSFIFCPNFTSSQLIQFTLTNHTSWIKKKSLLSEERCHEFVRRMYHIWQYELLVTLLKVGASNETKTTYRIFLWVILILYKHDKFWHKDWRPLLRNTPFIRQIHLK
jgi:hypothetical protein